uniref:Uncharacterized protein n=1 Tax=Mycena chlorophos TaxID=658473 RepID=A0ABQ0KUD2_MYCCL|nr:predicted protein [Mycena chlorophos]
MEELHRRLLLSPLYLASGYAVTNKRHVFKRKESGHVLCTQDGGQYKISILTVIGKVSHTGLFVDGLGGWRDTYVDTPIEKAKYQMQLERPEGTPFAPEWDAAIANMVTLQNGIKKTASARNLIVDDNPSERYLRFVKNVFEERTPAKPSTPFIILANSTDSQTAGYDTDAWPVPEEYEMLFFEAGQKHNFEPILAIDQDGARIGGSQIESALRGNIVIVHFSVRHYKLRENGNSNVYAPLRGNVECDRRGSWRRRSPVVESQRVDPGCETYYAGLQSTAASAVVHSVNTSTIWTTVIIDLTLDEDIEGEAGTHVGSG